MPSWRAKLAKLCRQPPGATQGNRGLGWRMVTLLLVLLPQGLSRRLAMAVNPFSDGVLFLLEGAPLWVAALAFAYVNLLWPVPHCLRSP
jgi:hypothetical protein